MGSPLLAPPLLRGIRHPHRPYQQRRPRVAICPPPRARGSTLTGGWPGPGSARGCLCRCWLRRSQRLPRARSGSRWCRRAIPGRRIGPQGYRRRRRRRRTPLRGRRADEPERAQPVVEGGVEAGQLGELGVDVKGIAVPGEPVDRSLFRPGFLLHHDVRFTVRWGVSYTGGPRSPPKPPAARTGWRLPVNIGPSSSEAVPSNSITAALPLSHTLETRPAIEPRRWAGSCGDR